MNGFDVFGNSSEWQTERRDVAASKEPTDQGVRTASHTVPATAPVVNQPDGVKRLPAVTNPFDPELFNRRYARDAKAKQLLHAETK